MPTSEADTIAGLFSLVREQSMQITEIRRQLGDLIRLEQQHAATRDGLNRAFLEINKLESRQEKDTDLLLSHHNKDMDSINARLLAVEKVQEATGPLNALIRKAIFIGIGLIVVTVLGAALAVVIPGSRATPAPAVQTR